MTTDIVKGAVSLRHLSKSFTLNSQSLPVLRSLSLDIRAGEALAIVGPSGCGKERAVIYQEPRLLPWLTVLENVFFGLEVRGMAQRVGIARALTVQPGILLLDEPLGALDAITKLTMQEELARIWSEEKITMILVTHDLEEAIFLADRVLVLSADGTPPALIPVDLPRPRDRNRADFVAMRRMLMGRFGLH